MEDLPVSQLARCCIALVLGISTAAARGQTSEEKAAHHLDAVRDQPSLLLAFLREMPKGGDLHNHLAGAIYAESWIDFVWGPRTLQPVGRCLVDA